MIRKRSLLLVLSCILICVSHAVPAVENTTQKAVPLVDPKNSTAATTAPATTPKPKIDIKDSFICKKCQCDENILQIDCSNKSMSSLFTNDQWAVLQSYEIKFETIIFSHNNISHIPQIPAYPVKNLYFSFNQINNISLGAFQSLDQLTKLDLSYNKLTSKNLLPHIFMGKYNKDAYEPLNNMKALDLAYNELHSLRDDVFEHLPNLESLILCKNTFQIIDRTTEIAIGNLKSLKTLDMSYLEIKTLPETMFHSIKDLEVLLISGNLFQKIPKALSYVTHLKKLVMDENPLVDLGGDNVFESLNELEYLSISDLPDLTKIGPYALSSLQNLTTFVATNNPRLCHIDVLAFSKNTSYNDILSYPPLETLYLSSNNLTTIEHDWIQRWDKVTDIDLRFNPWACDCSNSWLIHSLIKRINETRPVHVVNVNCATPAAWKNKPLLQLSADNKELICENTSHPEKDSLILVGILVGVLVGIPLTLGALVVYRRGCFGLVNRGNPATDRSLYNRASFADDFHI